MIHSLSGGVIREYDSLTYVFVKIDSAEGEDKRWFISPFFRIKAGDRVAVPRCKSGSAEGTVLRVERVTAQTAPYPVNRTAEIERVLPPQ